MAKVKNQTAPTTAEPGKSITTFHSSIEEVGKQIESFLNALNNEDKFCIECFTNKEGYQVTATKQL